MVIRAGNAGIVRSLTILGIAGAATGAAGLGGCASRPPANEASAPAASAVSWSDGGFEQGDFRGWSLLRLASPDSARIIQSPVRFGKHAAAITLRPGQRYGDGWKSELSDPYLAPTGPESPEIWYRISHYLPAGLQPRPGVACVLAQWHASAYPGAPAGKPPLAHRLKQGELRVEVHFSRSPLEDDQGGESRVLFSVHEPERERWHDFVYRVRWSPDERGLVDAWYGGKRVARYRGPVGYPRDPKGIYFKTGMYCSDSPERPYTAYVDEYRRGASADEVLLPGERIDLSP